MTENSEKRASSRHRTLKKGKIVFNNRYCSADCTIRNESETGALLLVTQNHIIPTQFELNVYPGTAYRPVQIVWRTADALGVRFLDRAGSVSPPMPKDGRPEPQPSEHIATAMVRATLPVGASSLPVGNEQIVSASLANPADPDDTAFVPKNDAVHGAEHSAEEPQAADPVEAAPKKSSADQWHADFIEKRLGNDRRFAERRRT